MNKHLFVQGLDWYQILNLMLSQLNVIPCMRGKDKKEIFSEWRLIEKSYSHVITPFLFLCFDQEIINELTYSMQDIGTEAWCKVYFMEKRCRLSDYQIKSPAMIVDGYAFQHPGRYKTPSTPSRPLPPVNIFPPSSNPIVYYHSEI